MTAWHCGLSVANADNVEVYWEYETSTCGGAAPAVNTLDTTFGCTVLVSDFPSDWVLVGS